MNKQAQYQYMDMIERKQDLYAQTKYKIIVGYLKNKKNLKILNAGCGSGELSFLLAAEGHNITGIDPSEEYIDLARKNLPVNLKNLCSFRVSSIKDLFEDEKYDCVIATDVLEHIKDDACAIKKLAGLLRPEGGLIVTVPAMPSLFGFHDEQLNHYRRYTKSGLKFFLENFGSLTIKKIRYFGFTLVPVCFLYSKVWRRPYPVGTDKRDLFSLIKSSILKLILFIDRFCPFPAGTSLICLARKASKVEG